MAQLEKCPELCILAAVIIGSIHNICVINATSLSEQVVQDRTQEKNRVHVGDPNGLGHKTRID